MSPRLRTLVACVPVIVVVLVGCRRDEPVRTYTLSKSAAKVETPAGADKERILGAIIPAEPGYSWFVKFSGPIEVVSAHEKEFDRFLEDLQVVDGPRPVLKWLPPEGWRDGPTKAMRQVTFQFGPSAKPVDLYVSAPFGGSLLENVNRWRREVGAADVTEADLPTAAPEIQLAFGTAHRVDARGPGGKGGMMAPFAK